MTQIEQLISKIEEKKYNYKAMLKSAEPNSENFYCCRARVALCEELLIAARATLKEPASEDLEKASEEYAYTNWESDDYHEGASEGKPFDAIGHTQKCFIDGAQWQKEQMMKDAIEGWIARDKDGGLYLYSSKPIRYQNFCWNRGADRKVPYELPKEMFTDITWDSDPQKVKVIIIKE